MTATIEPLLSTFGAGVNGIQPAEHAKSKVAMFWKTLMPLARPGDVAIDIYGVLSFDIRLTNGLILMAEIELDRTFFGRAYYEGNGPTAQRPRLLQQPVPNRTLPRVTNVRQIHGAGRLR